MTIRKSEVRPLSKQAAMVLRLSNEIEFWKAEHTALLKKVYPASWKEESWKAALRWMERSKEGK